MGRHALVLASFAACSSARGEPRRDTVVIQDVPHVRQRPDFCGEACVAMYAQKLGVAIDQDDVFAATGLDPALGRGAYTPDLVRAVKALGFEPPNVYTLVDARAPAAGIARELAALRADLARDVPSIVCMHYDAQPHTTEHFRLVVGYDAERDEIVYQEPAVDRGGYRRMDRALFAKLWPLPSSDASKRVLVRIPLVAKHVAAPARVADASPADYAQHVMALRERLADAQLNKLAIRIEKPFVVIGDAGAAALARDAKTVRWAADHLERDFFDHRPTKIIDIFLFGSARSYERGVLALTKESPTTPYGFYSRGSMYMNIATGGGTLVHEIVHPYVEADFPDAPSWLNEGLGSLFEQSAERDGHIVGLTNWRLAGLQRALNDGRVPTFRALASFDSDEFYGDASGVNYATSRYLLYYLQEKQLLRGYYRAFRAARAKDPTGYATLQTTLGERDMDDFAARWRSYVAALKFP
jgi:hypothetical protein